MRERERERGHGIDEAPPSNPVLCISWDAGFVYGAFGWSLEESFAPASAHAPLRHLPQRHSPSLPSPPAPRHPPLHAAAPPLPRGLGAGPPDTLWFKWNAELHAELVALLTMAKQELQAQSLLDGIEDKLNFKQRMGFNRALIQQYAKFGLKDEMLACFESLPGQSSPHTIGLSLSCLLQAYTSMDLPHEALSVFHDMEQQGFKPSFKDYKAIVFSFGKCSMFDDLEAFASDMEEVKLMNDPVVFNMILTTYATVENHGKVKAWLNKLVAADLKPSVRTLNAVAKACRVLTKIAGINTFVKMGSLLEFLKDQGATGGELEIVNDLLGLCLIEEVVSWESAWQLDLHSTAMGSAYVMLCCWLEEITKRLKSKQSFPSEIAIVTGWGKHSDIRGKSLTKLIIRDLLESVGSPFRVDSQNKGRLLAKPHVVAAWFIHL